MAKSAAQRTTNREAKAAPRPRTKQGRGLATRDQILDAAIELISLKGYPEASTQNIAEHAGVSRGALQHHFPSREDLFIAIGERLTDRMVLQLGTKEFMNMDTRTRVSHIVDQYWSVFGSVDNVVLIQVNINEPQTSKRHQDYVARTASLRLEREQEWVRIFADAAAPSDEIVIARRFTQMVLRGFALYLLERAPTMDLEPQLAYLKAALTEMLKPTGN